MKTMKSDGTKTEKNTLHRNDNDIFFIFFAMIEFEVRTKFDFLFVRICNHVIVTLQPIAVNHLSFCVYNLQIRSRWGILLFLREQKKNTSKNPWNNLNISNNWGFFPRLIQTFWCTRDKCAMWISDRPWLTGKGFQSHHQLSYCSVQIKMNMKSEISLIAKISQVFENLTTNRFLCAVYLSTCLSWLMWKKRNKHTISVTTRYYQAQRAYYPWENFANCSHSIDLCVNAL